MANQAENSSYKTVNANADLEGQSIYKAYMARKKHVRIAMVIASGWLCFSFYLSIPGEDFLSGLREVLQSPAAFFSTIAVFCFVIALLGVLYRIVSGTLTVSQAGLAVLLRTEDTVLRGEELPPVKTLVGRLAEMPAIQNMGAVGVQVGMLNGLPARHWESPAAFGAILATMPRENAQPHPKRALAQFIVNLLLAVGIVGTFYGLINFLSDPVFLGVLADPRTIQGANSNLTTIAHSFRIAFGTSLLAYGLHAAGRTILDILDDDADAVWKAYQVRLLLPLIHAFPNRPDTLEFRLRGRPEVALDKVAAALQAAGSEIQQTRQDLMATVHAMIAHARTMAAMAEEAKGAAAVAGAGAATVGEAASVITGGLRDTVTVFSAGTAEFKTAATALKTAIDTQSLNLRDAQSGIDIATLALKEAASTAGQTMMDGMAEAVGSMRTAMTNATGQIDAAASSLAAATKNASDSYAAMKVTVETLAGTAQSLELATHTTRDTLITAVTGLQASLAAQWDADRTLRSSHLNALNKGTVVMEQVQEALEVFSHVLSDRLSFEKASA